MTDRVVVVGASGMGRETLDVLEAMRASGSDVQIAGVIDDSPSWVNLERLSARGVPYLGTVGDWLEVGNRGEHYVVGIGAPRVRKSVVDKLEAAGFHSFRAIHPTASIGSRSSVAEGVVVCAGAVISTNVSLAHHVHVNTNATIGHDSVVMEFVSVNPGAVVSGEVHISALALVGANATILQGLRVGAESVLGAASCLTKSCPPRIVAKGVPARW